MTPGEFKAWFDGFCEAFDKTPTQKQWARIKGRVAEIDGKPVTEKVFIDRYWPNYYVRPPYWQGYWPYYGASTSGGVGGVCSGGSLSSLGQNYQDALRQVGSLSNYSGTNAMNLLGRAEAQAMTQ